MIVSEVPILEIICSLSACVSVYLYGNGSLKAPLFGICSQFFWWAWTIQEGLYFMMLLNVVMTLTHIRNIIKMKGRR